MDQSDSVTADRERLARLEYEIDEARHNLDEETHQKEKDGPLFYEDNQEEPEK